MTDLNAKVDSLFAEYDKPDSPGCALAIVQNGEVIYQRGYGMANLDYDIPITPDTVFHVASVSKQFTVMAILLLEADGKLSLDDDIRKYVPEIPDYGTTITIRHLIHHSSGLRDQWEILMLAGWEYSEDLITNRHVLNIASRQKELNFAPGEEYAYCNTGYTLMAIIVERISGKSFREFTHEHIFEPLGMTQTHFHDDHSMIVKKRAMAYFADDKGAFKICIPTFDTVGATSLFTTVLDLAKWEHNYYHHKVGGDTIAEKMLIPGKLNNGKELTYAAGVDVSKYKGLATIGHSGGDAGYRSRFITFPDYCFGVIVLANVASAAPGKLAQDIADIYLAEHITAEEIAPEPIQLTPDERSKYAGLYYHLQRKTTFQLTEKDNGLTVNNVFPLVAITKDKLQLQIFSMEMLFSRDEADNIETANLRSIGSDDENIHQRTTLVSLSPDELATYQGIYYSDELLTHYEIVLEAENLILRHYRSGEQTLKTTMQDSFKWGFSDIQFERDAEGKILGFRIFSGRLRGLLFQRVASASPLNNS
jgi:CubicO group peptidase (beta-lactamase class C family)